MCMSYSPYLKSIWLVALCFINKISDFGNILFNLFGLSLHLELGQKQVKAILTITTATINAICQKL